MVEKNNRWWEFYVARYLAGNIFAVLMLFYLVTFHGNEIKGSLCNKSVHEVGCSYSRQGGLCIEDYECKTIQAKSCPLIKTKSLTYKEKLCNELDFSSEIFGFIFNTTKVIESAQNKTAFRDFDFDSSIDYEAHRINTTEINFANIFILGVFGFLYMYISSIPIYFLHITRGAWIWTKSDKEKEVHSIEQKDFEKNNIFGLKIAGPIIAGLIIIFALFSKFHLALFAIPIIPLIIYFRLDNIYIFSKKSTFTRDKIESAHKKEEPEKIKALPRKRVRKTLPSNPQIKESFSPEYITSYKHDREHGNAFGVILMELAFAFFLIECEFSIWAIICWLILGFSGWLLGILLEVKMVNESNKT
ncbi:MAG: hypothetical protein PHU14_01970 [Methylovulum sp.]|nr:hypothetical protein [Methylovulum sp.]